MRNLILFFTIFLTITVSLCIGVPRYNKSAAPPSPASAGHQQNSDGQPQQGVDGEPLAPAVPRQFTTVPDIGRIQVLNGCGVSGAADKMADFLRTKHFDVKDIGNASSWNYPTTMIISRTVDMGLANELEKILKTGKVVLIRNKDSHLYDVTVVVGPDYETKVK